MFLSVRHSIPFYRHSTKRFVHHLLWFVCMWAARICALHIIFVSNEPLVKLFAGWHTHTQTNANGHQCQRRWASEWATVSSAATWKVLSFIPQPFQRAAHEIEEIWGKRIQRNYPMAAASIAMAFFSFLMIIDQFVLVNCSRHRQHTRRGGKWKTIK